MCDVGIKSRIFFEPVQTNNNIRHPTTSWRVCRPASQCFRLCSANRRLLIGSPARRKQRTTTFHGVLFVEPLGRRYVDAGQPETATFTDKLFGNELEFLSIINDCFEGILSKAVPNLFHSKLLISTLSDNEYFKFLGRIPQTTTYYCLFSTNKSTLTQGQHKYIFRIRTITYLMMRVAPGFQSTIQLRLKSPMNKLITFTELQSLIPVDLPSVKMSQV